MIQINENVFIDWAVKICAGISSLFAGLAWYIWRGDRRRLRDVEAKVSLAITKTEVEDIVKKVEDRFHQEHKSIISAIEKRHDEIRQDIRDLRDAVMVRWDGKNRRDKE